MRISIGCFSLFLSLSLSAQISFSDKTGLINTAPHYSGSPIAVCDMNGDGLDDIIRLNHGRYLNIQYQVGANQTFLSKDVMNLPGNNDKQWGICTGDIDNNGYPDIMTGGFYDGIKIGLASNDGSSYTFTSYGNPGIFVQGVNFADINNDGWLDAFSCHDDGAAVILGNNTNGTFTYQPNWIDLSTSPSSDNSGNYGSIWSDVDNDGDLDLYIAHCRQGVNDPEDPRRINQLFINNGNNTFTQDITNAHGLRIGAQSWTADFGDIDNDGDFDCFITNHDVSSQLLINDGHGYFTDISFIAGILDNITGASIQGVFRDFDNDGYLDIIVGGDYHYILRNNHDLTFTSVDPGFGTKQIESFAIGDLNNDGFLDIYGGYALVFNSPSTTPDVMWMNNGNANHFVGLHLKGVQSNRGGVGAKIRLYSATGNQVREIHSGESYGISNSLAVHFGIGAATAVDSIVVNWPSGVRDVILEPQIDQYINLEEGGCYVKGINISALGSTIFCTGQSVQLEAPAGYTYLWNNGDTAAISTVQTSGIYHVTVSNDKGCTSVSNNIQVIVDPVEIPNITAQSDTVFCKGATVVLTSSAATGYLWNTGATTPSIEVSEPGQYFVTTQGLCAQFTSPAIGAHVLDPDLPTGIPDTILTGESAVLLGEGDLINWYPDETSQVPLFTGNQFVTPPLQENTTYWISNKQEFGLPNKNVGMRYHQGTSFGSLNFVGGLYFDCFKPCKLARVKVYTNKAGVRKINLVQNGVVIQAKNVNIPLDSSIVELGFDLPVGNDLLLTTDQFVNQSNFGTTGPQLRRSDANCQYPYDVQDYISIKKSTLDNTRYYYFYHWEVEFPSYLCESERVPVTAVVMPTNGTQDPNSDNRLSVYPNPSAGWLRLEWPDAKAPQQAAVIHLVDMQGVTQRTWSMEDAGMDINVGDLPQGAYFLKFNTENSTGTRKILIH